MDIKYIETRMWIKCMRLSWYGSTLDIDTMEIPYLERLQDFTTQLTSLIIRGPYDI